MKCRKYGISLNPKKSNFALEEGKLLGHIISKYGIKIDPERVSAILKVEEPRSKKEIQSFLGQVNFLRIFVPRFAEILMNITNMLKKGHEIKWNTEAKESFWEIKKAISEALVLVSPDFAKDFSVFSYASEHTIAAVLLQKNDENLEQPIAFFSKMIRDGELKYDIMEK